MISSLGKRFFSAIFILWIISLIAFWLSKQAPGDEVMDYLSIDDPRSGINSNPLYLRTSYQKVAHHRLLDLPLFYWSVTPGYYPDTVDHVLPLDDREALKDWIEYSKNGTASFQLYKELHSGLLSSCSGIDQDQMSKQLCQTFDRSLKTHDPELIRKNILALKDNLETNDSIDQEIIQKLSSILLLCDKAMSSPVSHEMTYIFPQFTWHGTQNQYHQWMRGLVSQKPLTSLIDGLNAWSKIYDAMKWTLVLNGLAYLLAIFLGVGIGIWSGTHDGKPSERILNWILFALFALPSFWLGTLFIYFLASGEWFSIFPAGGLGPYQSAGNIASKWTILLYHLVLPVTCLALGALAYVSRQMKQSVLHQMSQPYVKALRAQGISETTIVSKHVTRNALFPVITIIGGSIPALLSGSLIIEVIYDIPGMGRLIYSSLLARDWPVVFPVLMIGAAITVISYVLTDIIYKWVDPRVKTIEG